MPPVIAELSLSVAVKGEATKQKIPYPKPLIPPITPSSFDP